LIKGGKCPTEEVEITRYKKQVIKCLISNYFFPSSDNNLFLKEEAEESLEILVVVVVVVN
jgi:hypothetical protein